MVFRREFSDHLLFLYTLCQTDILYLLNIFKGIGCLAFKFEIDKLISIFSISSSAASNGAITSSDVAATFF